MEETEEQCLVPVLQAGEVDVALERCRLATIVLVHAGQLLVYRAGGGRHEPVEAEVGTLALGEGRAFVRQRIAEQRFTARVDGDVLLARHPIVLGRPFHCSRRGGWLSPSECTIRCARSSGLLTCCSSKASQQREAARAF